ncbi:cobalt-precorrin-6A reductase [Phaeovibrio sulfidiphilus]|uniref:Cobalt-precorrin-6A reductase n=1 Tax=Phaeovibrio sulfidiphilus TaxID=1220600 RepID=A0A8J7CVI5_9PROT|nr:cobalt-precorrin-6A reductase [Phaeovibrio sulfidiphilus]MBE1236346.1 cobalt-precorrin-6A reductase [Phaeovibrio sulfidiphilus]
MAETPVPSGAVLVLGGTTEGYALAAALHRAGVPVVSSFAGRTQSPREPEGALRVGGFGGVAGLARYLGDTGTALIVDATHPFASRMGWNADGAARETGVPLLRLERPEWVPAEGDRWDAVPDWETAADLLERDARCVFLALGRQELDPFARLDGVRFVIRSVDRPDPMPPFREAEILLARGPFDLAGETALLQDHGIDTIVCKNSGGEATRAKLLAARDLGVRVVMRQRPQRPQTPRVGTVAEALDWIRQNGPFGL